MRRLFLVLLPVLLLTACELPPETEILAPPVRFDAFAPRRLVNLEKVLGSDITLLGPDTLQLHVRFDAATRRNVITAPDSTEVLDAQVFRYRRLYYAVERGTSTGYWVHALRIRGRQVQGLTDVYRQMWDLSAAVQRGGWPELVRYRSADEDSICLRFDAKTLRPFYQAELDSLPSYELARPPRTPPAAAEPTTEPEAEARPAPAVSLYPNPAATQVTLSFGTPAARTVQLYDPAGRLVQTITTQSATLEMPVRDLAEGVYTLRISGGSRAIQSLRLMVKHT